MLVRRKPLFPTNPLESLTAYGTVFLPVLSPSPPSPPFSDGLIFLMRKTADTVRGYRTVRPPKEDVFPRHYCSSGANFRSG